MKQRPGKTTLSTCVLLAAWLLSAPCAWSAARVDYRLEVSVDPHSHELAVVATMTLPAEMAGQAVEFLLSDGVEIESATPAVKRMPQADVEGFVGINGSSSTLAEDSHAVRYALQLPADGTTVTLNYRGDIYFPLGDLQEQYTRGFRETAGLVGEEGIYLAGSSLWYPYFSKELISFDLDVNVPPGWHLISQGDGTSRDNHGRAHWNSAGAVDEINLVGGPLVLYEEPAGAVQAQVYLHEPDAALAKKYLTATAQYLEMYRGLIGPYPYRKFALVENFWETGYGMPSFTLLGRDIIRFPFILTSSYPHEILHNWWGNSVFVEYESGNWCEGLTAHMAAALMREQRGSAAVFRRDALKKYRDFAAEGRDFPLAEFRSRHSAATEAVGYGKTAMGFHMLRLRMGDQAFKRALAQFYRDYRGKRASFDDVRSEMEQASGEDLSTFFEQWVQRTGAVDLAVEGLAVTAGDDGYRVSGVLRQRQQGDAYELVVPLYLTTADGLEIRKLAVSSRRTPFEISAAARPLLLEVDPEFDVFRLIDARETAPSIGQVFGEPEILAVIPADESTERQAAYRALAEGWQSEAHHVTVVLDSEVDSIPPDRGAWLFGRSNRLAATLFASDPVMGLAVGSDSISVRGEAIPLQDHSIVLVRRHPGNTARAVGWIIVDPDAAFPGLAGKLPHYGRYSYLGFAGEEPVNRVKGEWPATDSPLRIDLRPAEQRDDGPVVAAKRPPRQPLAELPPVFSRSRLMKHIEVLASPDLGGRGLGTPELEIAADYIGAQFEAAGLKPGGDDGTFFQVLHVNEGEDGKPHDVRNVIGYLPGRNPAFAGQAVLLTAHYDHLGHGWPDARQGDKGKVYPGADDNASGVAVMIEVMKSLVAGPAPERSIVFIGFTAEEVGLLGSHYYATHPRPVPLDGIIGVVNLDTVGRLGDRPITVFSTGSAKEWAPLFMGVGFTTGIKSKSVASALASSDQQSFIEQGIPAVQVSTGANTDYHRPSDTIDKVDGAGLVKVATVVKEAVAYLAERPEPMTVTISAADAKRKLPERPAGKRRKRASFGSVPDFGFEGPGVRFDMVIPDSPAAKAGFKAGDVLLELAGKPVADLPGFTALLRELEAGDTVSATVQRGDERITADVTLTAR